MDKVKKHTFRNIIIKNTIKGIITGIIVLLAIKLLV